MDQKVMVTGFGSRSVNAGDDIQRASFDPLVKTIEDQGVRANGHRCALSAAF
jgi:hypothetical protein